MSDTWLGRVIADRYRIVEPIGTGGMADVYRGEHVHMRKRVAIKVLNPTTEKLPDFVARFEREAIAGAQVHHPNVASATDFGQLEDGSYFLVLEYIRGTTLRTLLDEGPLPPWRAAVIAHQLALGLAAAHDAGVVHRDIKPANVMLVEGPTDSVKLIDFGFAKIEVARLSGIGPDEPAPARGPLTGIGQMFGTPKYMAPESIGGMDVVDERSDLYSFGCVLYEMLSGRRPFEIEDKVELFGKKASEAPPALSDVTSGVPPQLEALTMKLLERDPAARFESAHAVAQALESFAVVPPAEVSPDGAAETSSLPPSGDVTAAKKRPGAVPWVFAAVALVVGTIAIGVIVRTARPRSAVDATAPPAEAVAAVSSSAEGAAPPAPPEAAGSGSRADLWKAVAKHDHRKGAAALLALAETDPAAFREADVITAAGNIAVAVDALDAALAQSLFDLFANKLGADGVDVLFDIVRTRGGEKGGARRAMQLLRDDQVLAHASPAMRIALELRLASCIKKRDLYDRAVAEGDQRALTEMKLLRAAACGRKAGPCCYKTDKPLFDAINGLKARLGVQLFWVGVSVVLRVCIETVFRHPRVVWRGPPLQASSTATPLQSPTATQS